MKAAPRKSESSQRPATAPVQRKATKTRLPDHLQAGVENLSGHAPADAPVPRSSAEPARLPDHAHAQGSDIHLAPGQEKSLPHEGWHQAPPQQGRTKPTRQLKDTSGRDDGAPEK